MGIPEVPKNGHASGCGCFLCRMEDAVGYLMGAERARRGIDKDEERKSCKTCLKVHTCAAGPNDVANECILDDYHSWEPMPGKTCPFSRDGLPEDCPFCPRAA